MFEYIPDIVSPSFIKIVAEDKIHLMRNDNMLNCGADYKVYRKQACVPRTFAFFHIEERILLSILFRYCYMKTSSKLSCKLFLLFISTIFYIDFINYSPTAPRCYFKAAYNTTAFIEKLPINTEIM